jgi:hypothetical protein
MTMKNRRSFVMTMLGSGLAGSSAAAFAQGTAAHVDEADEGAVALGYKHDTTKVDAKKYASHTAAQKCSNCSFWQAGAADAWGGCAMFGRKHVNAAGWCTAWAKKPG